jgi:ubiquinone/menaquinone biosynthesis C-methylase UbiE
MDSMTKKTKELDLLLANYQKNVQKIWNLRANDIFMRWNHEKGDFKVIEKVLNAFNPSSLLEIGYGYGRLAPLYKKIPFVIGMDISQTMLKLSEMHNKGRNKVKTLLGDIRGLPFKDASFSCFVSVRMLNHIHPDDFSLVEQEMTRVCRNTVILLESDTKVPGADYEFEHDYDRFLKDDFRQIKNELEKHVYLRTYIRRIAE